MADFNVFEMMLFTLWIYLPGFLVNTFAMMWGNIRSINKMMDEPIKYKHPEAPDPGEEVMYVDVSTMNSTEFNKTKQSLEDLYND